MLKIIKSSRATTLRTRTFVAVTVSLRKTLIDVSSSVGYPGLQTKAPSSSFSKGSGLRKATLPSISKAEKILASRLLFFKMKKKQLEHVVSLTKRRLAIDGLESHQLR